MSKADLAIIGGGPGGYVAALAAAQRGAAVVLIEKAVVGGTCLNVGCVPTKVFAKTAEYYSQAAKLSGFGITVGKPVLEMAVVQERKKRIVETLGSGVAQLLDFRKVERLTGEAFIDKPGLITVIGSGDEKTELEAEKIIIATGARPAALPGVPFDGEYILDSARMLELAEIPSSLLVIGGGVIGLEFASIFARFGTMVTLVEMLPAMLPFIDSSVASALAEQLKEAGVSLHLSTKIKSVEVKDGKVSAVLESGGKTWQIEVDKVLVAAGRRPNADIGIPLGITEQGVIPVNDRMETPLAGIYAVGDVNGKYQLASVAYHEALVAAANATGDVKTIDYKVAPQSIFTLPEVSGVGLTEEEAQKDYEVKTAVFPFASSAKAMAGGDTTGFVKVVVDVKHNEILGAFIIGPAATELIHEFALAMSMEATLEEIAETMHAHPTLSEAIFEVAHLGLQRPIHFI